MKKDISSTLLLLLLFSTSSIVGQDEPPLLGINQSVESAMRMNSEVKKLEARLEGKSMEWKTAIGLAKPEISFAREGISAIDPLPFSEQRFAVQQELRFPLSTYYNLKKIQLEKEAMSLELEALKKEVKVRVKSHYVEVVYIQFIRKLRAESYRLAQDMAEAVRMRVESGVGTYIDQLSSEIRLVQAENDQYEAERLFHESRYKLFKTIGLDPDQQRYDITFSDTLNTHNELIEQEIALYTLETQPLYQSALVLLNASDFGIKEARSGWLPDARLGYLAQDFGTGYHFRGFEAGLKIPLWGGFTVDGNVKMARSLKNQLLWDQKALELTIKEKIELAWHGYDHSQVAMQLYQGQLKEKSGQLLSLTREAYRLGQIDLLKLIEAQQLYLTSQERYYQALRDYYLRLVELEQFVNQELVY